MNRRAAIALGVLALLVAAAIVWRLNVDGPIWRLGEDVRAATTRIRGMRIGTAAVVGMCLGVAGVILQSLLRNPLASPDIMGMSSAASLGVMVSIALSGGAGAAETIGLGTAGVWQAVPALVGALGALAVVYSLSQRQGVLDPTSLVLIGVVVSVMCGAGLLLLQHLMPGVALSPGAIRLLVGAISDQVGPLELGVVAVLGVLGTLVAIRLGPAMDAASLGDDEAASLGVSIRSFRVLLLGMAGLLTAGAVMLAGPLGFIGLAAPHAVRLVAGPGLGGGTWGGNRCLVLGSALVGPALVIGADALVSAVHTSAGRMPIGIVTAIFGGASFIVLLRAERRR